MVSCTTNEFEAASWLQSEKQKKKKKKFVSERERVPQCEISSHAKLEFRRTTTRGKIREAGRLLYRALYSRKAYSNFSPALSYCYDFSFVLPATVLDSLDDHVLRYFYIRFT